jgi:hypothetical protein
MTKVVFPASELVPKTANGFIDIYSKGYMYHEGREEHEAASIYSLWSFLILPKLWASQTMM